jgi:hypothetical protein
MYCHAVWTRLIRMRPPKRVVRSAVVPAMVPALGGARARRVPDSMTAARDRGLRSGRRTDGAGRACRDACAPFRRGRGGVVVAGDSRRLARHGRPTRCRARSSGGAGGIRSIVSSVVGEATGHAAGTTACGKSAAEAGSVLGIPVWDVCGLQRRPPVVRASAGNTTCRFAALSYERRHVQGSERANPVIVSLMPPMVRLSSRAGARSSPSSSARIEDGMHPLAGSARDDRRLWPRARRENVAICSALRDRTASEIRVRDERVTGWRAGGRLRLSRTTKMVDLQDVF